MPEKRKLTGAEKVAVGCAAPIAVSILVIGGIMALICVFIVIAVIKS